MIAKTITYETLALSCGYLIPKIITFRIVSSSCGHMVVKAIHSGNIGIELRSFDCKTIYSLSNIRSIYIIHMYILRTGL